MSGAVAWFAAALLALPTVLHLACHGVGLHGTSALGAVPAGLAIGAAFCAPLLAGRRRPALGLALALVFSVALPLLPMVLRGVPIALERVAVHGALAGMLLGFAEVPRSGRVRRLDSQLLLLLACASIGSAIGACMWNLAGSPGWGLHALGLQVGDLLLTRSPLEPTHPLGVLSLRLEWIALAACAGRVFASDVEAGWSLLRAVAWALTLGLIVALIDMSVGSLYRGESIVSRLSNVLDRSHRPLLDHNALGTALVLLLPLAVAGALRAMGRRRFELAMAFAGLGAGLFLLVNSRSKAAFGGVLAGLAMAALFALPGRGRLRSFALGGAAALGLALFALQAVPRESLESIERYELGSDIVRTLRADAAVGYLAENRLGPWIGAVRMTADHPLVGVGLGNYPRELVNYRDAERELAFNPEVENAHSQPLQIAAEEGLLGLLLSAAVVLLCALRLTVKIPELKADRRAVALGLLGGLVGCLLNLQLGHSLLEPTPAHLFGIILGAGNGLGALDSERSEPGPGRRAWALGLVLLLISAVPHALREPRPLIDQGLGLHPAMFREEIGRSDRLLAPGARWIVRWGSGSSMIVEARDVQVVTEIGERELTLEAHALGHAAEPTRITKQLARMLDRRQGNPSNFLRLRAPEGVEPGDLVEIRASMDRGWFPSSVFATTRDELGARVFDPVFRD